MSETDAERHREEACAGEYEEWRDGRLTDPLDDPEQEMAGWVEWMSAPRTGYPPAQRTLDWVEQRLDWLRRMHGGLAPYEDAGPETRTSDKQEGAAA